MKLLTLVAAGFIPMSAFASPVPGTILVLAKCTIDRGGVKQDYQISSIKPEKLVLGYVGSDGGTYRITIANNGNAPFEATQGAVAIGFARDMAPIRNPPFLCPTSPEDARQECLALNAKNNPPFIPAPSDHFHRLANTDGYVDAEVGPKVPGTPIDPDGFLEYKVVVPAAQIVDFTPVHIESPLALLGGVAASCVLDLSRN